MIQHNQIYTNNKGVLEITEEIVPWHFLRGIKNKDNSMGQAKDKNNTVYSIFPAPCDTENEGLTNNCYCWATAKKVKNQ